MASQPLVVQASTMPAVSDALIGTNTVPSVDARSLHAFLGSKDKFSTWMRKRIAQYGFVEGVDFGTFSVFAEKPYSGRPLIEYAITLDMAKELAMVERNEQGKRARQYFIECERRVLESLPLRDAQPAIPKTLPEALRLAADLAEKNTALETKAKEDAPKVQFHDAVTEAANTQTMQEAAKVLKTGPNRLFAYLREAKVLRLDNTPYQHYLDRGFFRVIQHEFFDHRTGKVHIQARTLVTGKGMTFLHRFVASAKHGLPSSNLAA